MARSAVVHRLRELTDADTHRLPCDLLGPPHGAAPEATAEPARLRGGLPLARHIVATQLLLRPRHGLADRVEWLRGDPVGRLPTRYVDKVLPRL